MKDIVESNLSRELAQRKGAHIELAAQSQTLKENIDFRFNYEPLFFSHPNKTDTWPVKFLTSTLNYPVWISSMTGGTGHAKKINQNLARLCGEYKLGMGLGSCRSLLEGDERLEDFKVRKFIGEGPLFANLGIAQLEELVLQKKSDKVHEMVNRLEATGLIIHLNPLQEWFQPEGDRYKQSPLKTIASFIENVQYPVLVKEVGQGLGPLSLKTLLEMPIAGIEFGAFGGTNFSMLENLRQEGGELKRPFINVGHTAQEMVEIINKLSVGEKHFIISGGIKNALDGYELIKKCKAPSIMGMAWPFLAPAMESYSALEKYFETFRESLLTAKGLLGIKGE